MKKKQLNRERSGGLRLLSILLAVVMLCGLLIPGGAMGMRTYADETDEAAVAESAVIEDEADALPVEDEAETPAETPTEEPAVEETPDVPAAEETPAEPPAQEETPAADEPEEADEADALYDRLMACTTTAEVDAIFDNLTAEDEAEMDDFTEEQNAALEAHLTELGYYDGNTLQNYSVTIAAGSSGTVSVRQINNGKFSSSTTGITGSYSNGTVTINVASTVAAGTYTVYVKRSNSNNGPNDQHTITVTVTSSGSSSGGSTTITPGNCYHHLDMTVAAEVKVKVYNADGTFSTQTVSATLSNPTATIYNTGSKTWSSSTGTDSTTGQKYWTIGFADPSKDNNRNAYEYMQNSPDRQETEFYNGDTVVLTYTLTYTLDGETHTVPVETSYVLLEENNHCGKKDSTGSERGFDYVASVDDVTTAFSTSQLQISKAWNDNNNTKRPDQIKVKVYQSISGDKKEYMTLTLNKDKSESSYTMASGITKDEDMVVTFRDNYGVDIVGLPANHWVESNGNYTYESCSYSVEEVLITDADGTISPVYGSFVYVDDTQTNSYIIAITNTLAYEKLAVKKVWADRETDNHDNDSIKVKLTAYYFQDGVKTQVPNEWLENFIGGSTEVTLSSANNWYQVLGYMPVYYTDGSTNHPITAFEVEETTVDVENNKTYTATYSGISTDKDTNGNYYFTVTNTPKPTEYTLTVKKTLSGNMYEPNDKFEFTVTYGESTEKFKLGNNETKTITIPVGASVSVTEDAGGYTYSLTAVTPKNLKYTSLSSDDGISFTMPESDVSVTINNKKEITIDTGVMLDSLPYLVILAAAVVGVAVVMIRKRRMTDED